MEKGWDNRHLASGLPYFLLDQAAYITVLGEPPPPELDQTITTHLAAGEPAALPRGVLLALARRRQQARRLGPWVEGHYDPGQPL